MNKGASGAFDRPVLVPVGERGVLSYRTEGRGAQSLVLLHGFLSNSRLSWSGLIGELAANYQVIAFDYFGHGSSAGSMEASFDLFADLIASQLEQMTETPVLVLGHSMGGAIGQTLARRHSNVVGGTVLSSTAARFSTKPGLRSTVLGIDLARQLAEITPTWPTQRLASLLIRGSRVSRYPGFDPGEFVWPEVLASLLQLDTFDSTAWVAELEPVVAILTERDDVVPIDRQTEMADHLPTASLIRSSLSHDASTTAPAAYMKVLSKALDLVTAGRRRL